MYEKKPIIHPYLKRTYLKKVEINGLIKTLKKVEKQSDYFTSIKNVSKDSQRYIRYITKTLKNINFILFRSKKLVFKDIQYRPVTLPYLQPKHILLSSSNPSPSPELRPGPWTVRSQQFARIRIQRVTINMIKGSVVLISSHLSFKKGPIKPYLIK